MKAVGLQIIATMNLEEGDQIGKLSAVSAAKYAALCVGTMPHGIKTNNNIFEERIGVFYLGSPPPSVEPHVLRLNRCMACRQRLERQDTFMSRYVQIVRHFFFFYVL